MPTYNKLVRDRIPEIIKNAGKSYNIKTLEIQEYKQELVTKLAEEISEYTSATNDEEAVEELADILEIIKALGQLHGAKNGELEEARRVKAEKRGGFEERIYLLDVED
jgi:predicted house-cleaning noncanonical NTP pyrophosphatase (MazG superfamily)